MYDVNLLHVVQNDERPDVLVQIYDETTGNPIDLSLPTTSVKARFRKAGDDETLFEATCSKVGDGFSGQVTLSWPTDSLDVDVGLYELQFIVDYAGDEQTVREPLKVKVWERFEEAT